MDFPGNDPHPVEPPEKALEALNLPSYEEVQYSDTNQKLLVLLDSEEAVAELRPDFDAFLAAENPLGWRGAIVTARSSGSYDFVSRFFAPFMGINEDHVTGSAHTVLAPYWAERLGKSKMRAYQSSEWGGEMTVELDDDRVYIMGKAVTVVVGTLYY